MREWEIGTPLEYGPHTKWFFDVVVVPQWITVPTTKLQRSTAIRRKFILSYKAMGNKIVTSETQGAHKSSVSMAVINIDET
ncbi:MAG: hypothetical protein IPG23_23960 [Burkholderiales bacterium]|nr:hypothetical protein [Burkholderiales bacterium]